MKLRLFWVLWGFDALISVIVVFFFFIGIADGSVSSFNSGIWIIILSVLAFILGGSFLLKNHGHTVSGIILLLLLAVPGFLSGLFIFLAAVSDTSWN